VFLRTLRTVEAGAYALLLFLYNSGARVTEAASLKIEDLNLRSNALSDVRLQGKGRKTRQCPLWPDTAKQLLPLTRGRSQDQPVFLNRLGQSITRYGIHAIVRKYLKRACASCPSLLRKRVSPHTIRHTTATHLLRSGVDINTIRAWLGHVSLETTNLYAEVDLERKAQALAQCNALQVASRNRTRWRDDPSLIAFLRAL